MLETDRCREAGRLHRLIGRYRDLLVEAEDALLRRGIEREIGSLEAKLRRLESKRRQSIPCLMAWTGPSRAES